MDFQTLLLEAEKEKKRRNIPYEKFKRILYSEVVKHFKRKVLDNWAEKSGGGNPKREKKWFESNTKKIMKKIERNQ